MGEGVGVGDGLWLYTTWVSGWSFSVIFFLVTCLPAGLVALQVVVCIDTLSVLCSRV